MTRTIRAAAAQDRPVVSLSPAEPAKWDLAGHVGWLGSNKSGIGDDWNGWYDAASGGVTAGYYLTPHVKTEFQVTASRQGRVYSQESIPVPGGAFPVFRSRDHFFSASTFAGGVSRQFFENQWFRPFVSGGLEIVRETHRIDTPQQFISGRPNPATPLVPVPVQILPATSEPTDVRWAARPYVAAGPVRGDRVARAR